MVVIRRFWLWCWLFALIGLSACQDSQQNGSAGADDVTVLETTVTPIPLENDTFKTRFGQLAIEKSAANTTPDTLTLNGKNILQKQGSYLSLHQYIVQNKRDIVLVGMNCADNTCPANKNNFYLLLLSKNAEPQVLTQEHFFASPDDVVIKADGDKLNIDLGFEAGKHKFATLQEQQFNVALETVSNVALGAEDCQWLYTDALQACMDAREDDTSCADPQSWFSDDQSSGMDDIADFPGFVKDTFAQLCKASCSAGNKTLDYPSFARGVCSETGTVTPLQPSVPRPGEGDFEPADATSAPNTAAPKPSQVP